MGRCWCTATYGLIERQIIDSPRGSGDSHKRCLMGGVEHDRNQPNGSKSTVRYSAVRGGVQGNARLEPDGAPAVL